MFIIYICVCITWHMYIIYCHIHTITFVYYTHINYWKYMWIHVSYLKTWWLNLLLQQLSAKHLFEAQRAPAHAADFSGLKFDLWSTSNSHDFKIQLDGLRYRTEKKPLKWMIRKNMMVSRNWEGSLRESISTAFSIKNHPFKGVPPFMSPHIYGPVLRLSTHPPQWVGSPGSTPPSLLFASYWQSEVQLRIC